MHTTRQTGEAEILEPCPVCGTDDALAPLGTRLHRAPWWLRWMSPFMPRYYTHIYLCSHCHEVVEIVKDEP